MSKIVAIVGRPNVGKSTLFNRIIGAREAIVHDEPGVTRDRIYGIADWAGKSFTLIDTGGFVPRTEDLIEQSIREQAAIAIDEADLVLFVVDGTDFSPLDEELATILRTSNKKVHLVVNKIDGDRGEAMTAQFYKLGFGDPISISALLGRNIGDFLDLITKDFTIDPEVQEVSDKQLRLAIIGKPNVGKSSLVNALLGKTRTIVTDIPGTTRDSINSILNFQGEEIVLIDTAGLRRKARVKESVEFFSAIRTLKAIEECNVAVLMADVVTGLDKQDLRILQRIVQRKRGVILAINKWDTVEKDSHTATAYEKEIRAFLRTNDYVPVIFISAQTKQRIYKLMEIAKSVLTEMQKKIPTSELNSRLQADIALRPPSATSGKEIKINYITQIAQNHPVFIFFVNDPRGIDENYSRYLEGKIREHWGFDGAPIALQFRRKN